MLGSDTSVDPDDLVNELKTDLVLLNGTLKKLDPDVDLWEVLRPLLAETGPAIAYAQKLGKQKIRMEKIRDDLVREAQGQSAARSGGTITGLPARSVLARPRPGPRTPVDNIGYDHFQRQAE